MRAGFHGQGLHRIGGGALSRVPSSTFRLARGMALHIACGGRLAQGGALEAPSHPPCALRQATRRGGAVVAWPTDIAPRTLPHRSGVLARAGLSKAVSARAWASSGCMVLLATLIGPPILLCGTETHTLSPLFALSSRQPISGPPAGAVK